MRFTTGGCFFFQDSIASLLIFPLDVIFDYLLTMRRLIVWQKCLVLHLCSFGSSVFLELKLVDQVQCVVHLLSHILSHFVGHRIRLDDPYFIIIYLFIASARAWWIWDYNVESDLRITSTWERSSPSKLPAKTLCCFLFPIHYTSKTFQSFSNTDSVLLIQITSFDFLRPFVWLWSFLW